MKKFFGDIKECFKMSLKVYGIGFTVGLIIGLIVSLVYRRFDIRLIFQWGIRFGIYVACFGLFIAAISFTKKEHMRPLNYQKRWETYFERFNLAHVVFFISVFCLLYSVILESIIFFL
ncbi:hypothetical protein ACER0A_012295 [Haloimpatiens sp. FM7315]|uniref:hypothetical protein n=1 Tax=Haloimpatiens sp. FM7315 TaxID=3298609 RepID=UPI0039777BD9